MTERELICGLAGAVDEMLRLNGPRPGRELVVRAVLQTAWDYLNGKGLPPPKKEPRA